MNFKWFCPFSSVILYPQEFCEKESCNDKMHLVKAWKIPVWVKTPELSTVLQTFINLVPPSKEDDDTYEDIVKLCNKKKFKFPGFPKHLGPNHLERSDERSDSIFYDQPRLVTHIDDYAIESLAKYYSENLESNTNLVDLCSSWISHLPKTLDFSQVIGIGMNEQELQKNSRLTKYYVHDLNKNPELKMIPDESIDTVLCAVSVDYLIRPFEVFSEVYRILKPGGSFIVSFSNRMFGTKVIKAWLYSRDEAHLYIATYYFQASAPWNKIIVSDITEKSADHRDPMYTLQGIKQ